MLDATHLDSLWVNRNCPLLNLSMSSSAEGKVCFSPSFDEIVSQLNEPLLMLRETASSFKRLDKTIVPFFNLNSGSDKYLFENKRFFAKMVSFIASFVSEQWDAYVAPLAETYSKYTHFFNQDLLILA